MGGASMAEADALALVAIARRDLKAARGMTDPTSFHEAVWGFQVQQTIEKALKAWLYLTGVQPPFTHDLVALLKLLDQAGLDQFTRADLLAAGRSAQLKRGRAEAIAEEVITAVRDWPRYAAEVGVPEDRYREIQASHRLNLLQLQHREPQS